MAKKMTTEEFKKRVYKKYGNKVEILSEFNGGTNPIDFVYHCEKHGDIYKTMNAKNIKNKDFQPCKKCMLENKSNSHSKNSQFLYDEFKEYIESKGGKLLDETWVKSKHLYKIKCENPDHPVFEMTHDKIMGKRKGWCPYCSGRKGDFQNYYKKLIESKDGEMLSEYNGATNYVKVKCNKHNYIWNIYPSNLSKERWCPICVLPKSEKPIYDLLISHNFNVDIQYTFDDLLSFNDEKLKFDFAILNSNNKLLLLIESDGEDHRQKVYTYSKRGIERDILHRHDLIKDNYCKDNNIKLIRIPFYKSWSYDYFYNEIELEWMPKIKEMLK